MTLDFTLRDVALRPSDSDHPGPWDLTFRQGRLAFRRPAPEDRRPRLFAVPGFWDAHVHLLHLGLSRQRLDLGSVASRNELLSTLEAYARAHPEKGVLWAEGWDETVWQDASVPQQAELDLVVPDRPAILCRVCGHLALLNSRAAAQAALRWPDLDPRGVLTEERAMGLATIWPPTPAEREQALLDAQDAAMRMGIVRVSEMGSEGAVDAYLGLLKRGTLRGEVLLHFRPAQIELALRLREEGWLERNSLRLGGIKVFADGSIGARTAALAQPFADGAPAGRLLYGDTELAELLGRCRAHLLPVAVHAIGDAAIEQVIRVAERIAAQRGRQPGEWISLEHAELIDEAQLERAARIGMRLSMQPNFAVRWGQAGGLYDRALGGKRRARANPLRQVFDCGIALVFGSDGMPMDPALGLRGAIAHPEQASRLSADEAVGVYCGLRARGIREWAPRTPWDLGCENLVLFESDPANPDPRTGFRAEARAILQRREWVLAPSDDWRRQGVVHDE